MYNFGIGVRKDYSQGFQWYLKGAELGERDAQFDVAMAYHGAKEFDGDVGSGRQQAGIQMFEQAAARGYALQVCRLDYLSAFMADLPRDDVKACTWLMIADRIDRNGEWGASHPQDVELVHQQLPREMTAVKRRLTTEQLAECDQTARAWR